MENYNNLLKDIKKTAGQLSDLYDSALVYYSKTADEVLAGRLTDEKQIEHILDGIIDFGDDLRFLALSKKLCRHIYHQYPQLVGNFVHTYRAMFEEKENDNNGTGDS